MGLFNNFPWTNFHELNLDWLIRTVKEIEAAFPEGLVGILKGGTGADNAADARRNLEIAGDTIPYYNALPQGDTVQEIIDNVWNLAGNADDKFSTFRFFAHVDEISNTLVRGSCTIGEVWTTMAIGNILIAPGSDFVVSEVPTTTGIVVICKTATSTGFIRFFGNRTYDMKIQAGVPEEYWRELVQTSDIIPVASGGTGADNAADARHNLGIDFTGTVLSVSGVGADSAGNVPLGLFDLNNVYTSLASIGLGTGSTITGIWNAINYGDIIIVPSTDVANPPVNNLGTILIYKGTNTIPGIIFYYPKNDEYGAYRMPLVNNVPSNTWDWIAERVQLWENSNPSQNFAAQTISVPGISKCKGLILFYRLTTANEREGSTEIHSLNTGGFLQRLTMTSTQIFGAYRSFDINTTNETIAFSDALQMSQTPSGGGTVTNITTANNVMIPALIMGLI